MSALRDIAHPEYLQDKPYLSHFFGTFEPSQLRYVKFCYPNELDYFSPGRRMFFTTDDGISLEIGIQHTIYSIVLVDLRQGTVKKFIHRAYSEYGIWQREIDWLRQLQPSGVVPELIEATDTTLTTRYCGEPVSEYSLPEDWKAQAEAILAQLKRFGCAHNDISAHNVVVANGRLTLLDFAWALPIGSKVPADWPTELGRHNLGTHLFDDRYALLTTLSEKMALAEAKAAAQQQNLKPPAPAAPPPQ